MTRASKSTHFVTPKSAGSGSITKSRVRGRGGSTLIGRVCATCVLNLPPCSGVENPKKYTLFWSPYCIVLYCIVLYCVVLYCIVLYCIVLETKTKFMLYLFNQMMLPFHFSSTMFARKSYKFSVTTISLSYDIRSAFTFYLCGKLSICQDKVKWIKYLVSSLDNLSIAFVYVMVEYSN